MRTLQFLNRQGSNEAAAEVTPSDCEGSGVFRGNVPQPWDWLSALSACRRLQSWTTATLASNDRRPASSRPLSQYTLKNMCEVKREVARARKRKWLSEATYVSLVSDDRQRYKLLKFKCDLGSAPPRAATELRARHGLIDHTSHDTAAYDSFTLKVHIFATDKALLKAVHIAKEQLFLNLILSLPDASHTVRIACRDPLHRVEPLATVFDTLFDREHAF